MRACPIFLILFLTVAGCQEYVPANIPIQLDAAEPGDAPEYRDQLGRSLDDARAEGPEYRLTMANGATFFMKSPRIVEDSVVGFYRPQKGTPWARASVSLYDVRLVEEQKVDWLATASLMAAPLTLILLITY